MSTPAQNNGAWKERPLSELVDIASGGTPSKQRPEYWAGPTPWLSPKDVKRPFLDDTEDHISAAGVKAGSRLAPAHTVFVVVRGMALAKDVPVTLGRVPMAFNQDVKALMARSDLDPEFLLFALMAHKARLMKEVGTAAHGTRRMGSSTLENFRVALPKPREQRAIAKILVTLHAAVEAEQRRFAILRELKAATMAKLFREGVRGERLKQTEVGEIPESWDVRALKDIATLTSGGTPSKANPSLWAGEIPWVSPKDLKVPRLRSCPDHVSADGVEVGSAMAPRGAIFVVVRGMILARDIPMALAEVPMAFNQDLKAIVASSIDSDFLFHAMLSRKAALEKEIGTAAHGTRRLGADALERWLIPIAPAREQRSIASALRTSELRLEAAGERLRAAQALFASTLHLLMTGQVRVPEALRS